MNRSTKIAIASSAAVVVVGGGIYLATRPRDKAQSASKKKGKSKPARMPPPPTMVWNDQMRAEMEAIAKDEWRKAGSPDFDPKSPRTALDLARSIAKRMYPSSPITQNDLWPKNDSTSSKWMAEPSTVNVGADAWRRSYKAALSVLGFVPVT